MRKGKSIWRIREINTFFYESRGKDFRNWYCHHASVIAYPQITEKGKECGEKSRRSQQAVWSQ